MKETRKQLRKRLRKSLNTKGYSKEELEKSSSEFREWLKTEAQK